MKRPYKPPKADIEKFTIADVLTTSQDPGGEGSGNEGATEF